ncbi:MAG: YbjN domain-containing protein [Heteroscytonema crispum UTEX LB 1556]
MNTHTENYLLNSELTLQTPSKLPLNIYAATLSLTIQGEILRECRLTFHVNFKLYQRIDDEALFNLKPELRGSFSNGIFQPKQNLEIQVTLQPDFLLFLGDYMINPNAAIKYLQNLNQEKSDHPLLDSESWYGLYVKQKRELGETGYSTFWSYVNPSAIIQDNFSQAEISEAMIDFFQDWYDANFSGVSQEDFYQSFSQSFDNITQILEDLGDTTLNPTPDTISEILEEVSNTFQELTDMASQAISCEKSLHLYAHDRKIFEEMLDFFVEEGWHYTKIKGEPVLRLSFEGKNSKWTCYAKARVQEQQMVFYSICPVNASESKLLAIAEFIARANYGMIVGNFELDFTDGEIRYKTGIDVESASLSFPLIKQLVYTNVTVMDEYLPGIISVINGEVSPVNAIAKIEQSDK